MTSGGNRTVLVSSSTVQPKSAASRRARESSRRMPTRERTSSVASWIAWYLLGGEDFESNGHYATYRFLRL